MRPRKQMLTLTVDHNGRPSLWDSLSAASRGKQASEVIVQIPLTMNQEERIAEAQRLAESRKQDIEASLERAKAKIGF